MEKVFKRTCLLLLVLMAGSVAGAQEKRGNSRAFDWNPVMEAIIEVESEGDAKAVSGNSCGAMQITPIMVRECNSILKRRKSKKRYTLADRFNVAKSKEMFQLFQSHYNPLNSVEQAIRSWNGGIRYSIRGTQGYYNRVMKMLTGKK